MTNEEIKKILDGAPEGATYYQVNSYVDEMGLVWRDGRWVDFGWDGAGTPLSTLREILELRQEVKRLRDAADQAFYNGYVRGVTFEKEGDKNHSEFLSEIAEDECRKYLDSEFYANTKYPTEGE